MGLSALSTYCTSSHVGCRGLWVLVRCPLVILQYSADLPSAFNAKDNHHNGGCRSRVVLSKYNGQLSKTVFLKGLTRKTSLVRACPIVPYSTELGMS